MAGVFPGLDAKSYQPHALHHPERDWPQTNCHTDLWIGILHARGLPPEAALGFTSMQDFEGDQFTFFKIPPEDLEALFDIRVLELSIYDSLEAHVQTQIARGRLCLIEVDGFHLPDTKGVSYRLTHPKTTIGINRLDAGARVMEYFHNDGFFRLEGDDCDGVLGLLPAQRAQSDRLFPYGEFVKFPERPPPPPPQGLVLDLLARHVKRAPSGNPILAWRGVIDAQVRALADKPPGAFHHYAFNTARQAGANFALLAAHLEWLRHQGAAGFEAARESAAALSAAAKSAQFQLARAVSRKRFDGLEALLDPLAGHYEDMMRALRSRLAD